MRKTKDYSRQRLADFLAARLKAWQAETTGEKPTPHDASLTSSPLGAEPPARRDAQDSGAREPSPRETSDYPANGIDSSY